MRFFTPIRPLFKGCFCSFALFGLLSLVIIGQFAWAHAIMPLNGAFQIAIREWLPWAIITPLVFRFASRLPLERSTLKISAPAHILCAAATLAFATAWAQIIPLPHQIFTPPPSETSPPPPRPPMILIMLVFRVPMYIAILSAAHAVYFYGRSQEREKRALGLEASLAKARLAALKMQLQPHFLFNSLNAIAELVHQNPDAADDMLMALSDLLRLTLETSAQQELPLGRELEFVERYLAIERVRFGKRLEANIEVPRELYSAIVPAFILQPLVENAIRHGMEPSPEEGKLFVRAHREESQLYLSVADNGAGLRGAAPSREGIGLSNTRARLNELYADSASLTLRNNDGLTVEVMLPYKTT